MSDYAFEGVAGATTRQASTDTAATINAAVLASGTVLAKGIFVQVDTNSIRLAFGGATPVAGAGGLGVTLAAGDTMKMSYTTAKKMKLVSAASGVHGGINITPEF